MQPPVPIRDRSEHQRRMKELLEIDPARTVGLTVDMQNDSLEPDCGTAPVAPEEAVRVLRHARAGAARGARLCQVASRRGRTQLREQRLRRGERASAALPKRAGWGARGSDRVDGAPQAELAAGLAAPGDVHVTTKRVMDAFHGTELDTLLGGGVQGQNRRDHRNQRRSLRVCATTFAAACRGDQPLVVSDCGASMRGPGHCWMALGSMSRSLGRVPTVHEFGAKVAAARTPAARPPAAAGA